MYIRIQGVLLRISKPTENGHHGLTLTYLHEKYLRTGTLLLLTFGLLPSSLALVYGTLAAISENVNPGLTLIYILITGSFTSIYAAGIYGVVKKRPLFLKPYLGVQVFLMLMVIISMVGTAIQGAAIMASSSNDNAYDSSIKLPIAARFICSEIGLLFVEVIYFYFFAVVLGFYKELNKKTQERNSV